MPKTIHSKVEEPTGNALQKEFTEADEAFFSEDNDEAPYYSLKDKRVRELKRLLTCCMNSRSSERTSGLMLNPKR